MTVNHSMKVRLLLGEPNGGLVELVNTSPFQGEDCGFNPRTHHQKFEFSRNFRYNIYMKSKEKDSGKDVGFLTSLISSGTRVRFPYPPPSDLVSPTPSRCKRDRFAVSEERKIVVHPRTGEPLIGWLEPPIRMITLTIKRVAPGLTNQIASMLL